MYTFAPAIGPSSSEMIPVINLEFLGISFKTKQYLELSRIIISKSLDNLLKTQKNITINLSFKDILNYEFIDYLDNVLEKLKFEDRNRLVFEILESENLSDYDFLEEFVLKYKKLDLLNKEMITCRKIRKLILFLGW